MDYVLFGMGYGASLMLLGWALRTFGPQLKYKQSPSEESAEYQVEKRFWIRFIQGLGGVIAIAGTAIVLLTFIVVLVNPDDSTGRNISLSIWAIVLIAVLVWCWFYRSNYGLAGIWSREGGYGFRGQSSSGALSAKTAGASADQTLSSSRKIERARSATAEPPVEEPEITVAESTELSEDTESSDVETLPVPEAETESGPVYDFGDGTETTVPSESTGRSEALRRMRERQAKLRQSTNQ